METLVDHSEKFWKNRKVLVTGHTGFKGTWMSIMLTELGADVCGYSLPLESGCFYEKAGVTAVRHKEGDISDYVALSKVIIGFQPEIIIHLASHSSLDGCNEKPDYILKTNIDGVINVLEISRRVKSVKSVLIVTSDKCYRNIESSIPYTEEAELGGADPYSVSKVCQELISRCYQDFFFEKNKRNVSVATARASNVIGIGDYNLTRLVPYLLEQFKKEEKAVLRNPKAVRPWQYVLDVVWGYLLLSQKLYEDSGNGYELCGAYNFGPGEDGFKKVETLVECMAKFFPNAAYEFVGENKTIETQVLKLDSSKARRVLGWKTEYELEDMLYEITDFVRKEKQSDRIKELSRGLVHRYFEKICRDAG